MILEVVAAGLLGALLVWLAVGPPSRGGPVIDEATDPFEDTEQGRALLALKELDFDRETGKISDDDYRSVRERLAREAIATLDRSGPPDEATAGPAAGAVSSIAAATAEAKPPACPRCGPRPEADARFCSACGSTI